MKKYSVFLTIALLVTFAACAEKPAVEVTETAAAEAPGEASQTTGLTIVGADLPPDTLPIPRDNNYIKELQNLMLQINVQLDQFKYTHDRYPKDLRELRFPLMKLEILKVQDSETTTREVVRGYFQRLGMEDTIYVQYERDSYGKKENPMVTVSYGPNFPKNRGFMQLRNGLIVCAAATGIAPANQACKLLNPIKEQINPIRAYYYIAKDLTPRQVEDLREQINMMEMKERAQIIDQLAMQAKRIQEQEEIRRKAEEADNYIAVE